MLGSLGPVLERFVFLFHALPGFYHIETHILGTEKLVIMFRMLAEKAEYRYAGSKDSSKACGRGC